MYSPGVIFIQLVISTSATNPYRDKINITSCENEFNKKPEMTFRAPEYLIPINEYHKYEQKGDIMEKVVEESELTMLSNDDCKLRNSYEISKFLKRINSCINLKRLFLAIELTHKVNLRSHNKMLNLNEGK